MSQRSTVRTLRGRSRFNREDVPHLSAMLPVTPARRVA